MNYSHQKFKRTPLRVLLFAIYLGLFVYCMLQPPIHSPDTFTYFRLHFIRFPAYGLFLRTVDLFFGSYYDVVVVGIQLVFGFAALHLLAKNCSQLFSLRLWQYLLLLAVLTFPFFPPLFVANNICTEGIAYPLYLLLISFTLDFLFREEKRKFFPLGIIFIGLCLTRGQFIVVSPILAAILVLRERKEIFKKPMIFYLVGFLLLPVLVQLLDRTYHKAVHGFFVTTPFSYSNAITLPLFVSQKEDYKALPTADQQHLFVHTHRVLDSLGLLSRHIAGEPKAKYQVFHDNFPIICNRTFHAYGVDYFEKKVEKIGKNVILVEESSKAMLPVLVKNNFREYISIFWQGVSHGFGGWINAVLAFLIFLYSALLILKKWTRENATLFLATTLLVSNALIVGFASHSIMRYLFYNYFFALLIVLILLRKLSLRLWK